MIEVRGPNVFAGYWQMPEKTAEELRPDGWFITGDIGRLDADGYVQIVGRAKDLVISGGFNVYPNEVELLLDARARRAGKRRHRPAAPGFRRGGVCRSGAAAGRDAGRGGGAGGMRDRLARFKQPKAAVVVDALPRNAMGKVQKAELRKTYGTWFAP